MGAHFTLAGALRGAGDTVTPLLAAGAGNWLFRVPISWLCARWLHTDVIWLWGALVFDHLARALWLLWAYRRGRWQRRF
jgi:Na+-driven multidrug efflux pump